MEDYNCIILQGPASLNEQKKITYTITQISNINNLVFGGYNVYINYLSGSLVNGIDFDGPTSLYIPEGTSSDEFIVEIMNPLSTGTIGVSIDYDMPTGNKSYQHSDCNGSVITEVVRATETEVYYCSNNFFWQEDSCHDFFKNINIHITKH